MIKRTAKVIHDARIFFFTFILVAFLYQVGLNPIDFGKYVGLKVVGAAKMNVSAGVSPNQYNKIAMQLEVKEDRLNQREVALGELEEKIVSNGIYGNRNLLFGLTFAIIALFMMMTTNFYFDLRRKKKIIMNSRLLKFLTRK
ncbi:hypothetical protein KAI92_01545 [Candidatus Parcubacteria bacterium]|nr:hypothetical protein [Candidatus Parcubacteria bacterium]